MLPRVAFRLSARKMHSYVFRTLRIVAVSVEPRVHLLVTSHCPSHYRSLTFIGRSFCSADSVKPSPLKVVDAEESKEIEATEENKVEIESQKKEDKEESKPDDTKSTWTPKFLLLSAAVFVGFFGSVRFFFARWEMYISKNKNYWKFLKMVNNPHENPRKSPFYIKRDIAKDALKNDVLMSMQVPVVTNVVTRMDSKGAGKSTLLKEVLRDIIAEDQLNGTKRSFFYFECTNSLRHWFEANGVSVDSEDEALRIFLSYLTRFGQETNGKIHCFIDSPAGIGRENGAVANPFFYDAIMREMKELSDEYHVSFYCLSSGGDRNIFTEERVQKTLGKARVYDIFEDKNEWEVSVFLNDEECFQLLDKYCTVNGLNWTQKQKKYVHEQLETRNISDYIYTILKVSRPFQKFKTLHG